MHILQWKLKEEALNKYSEYVVTQLPYYVTNCTEQSPLDKLTVPHLLKKFPTFDTTQLPYYVTNCTEQSSSSQANSSSPTLEIPHIW
jgi:hypothetical protein